MTNRSIDQHRYNEYTSCERSIDKQGAKKSLYGATHRYVFIVSLQDDEPFKIRG